MKTAMQEFIQNNFYIDVNGEYQLKWTEDTPMTDEINAAFEKEKEQIKNAFESGWNWNFSSEQYYNEIYNNENL